MVLTLALLCVLHSPSQDVLAANFLNPPASAKPHTWWHWMNGNVTKEGLKADLEAMKEVGIGGAQMFTVDQGIPHGPVDYNSEKWREMTAYAVQEASRLGIELCIHNCAGWSSSGGPWITPENAMQVVAWSTQDVRGPSHFSAELPPIKAPSIYARVDYARDIAVYAFPTPKDSKKWDHFLGKTGVIREDGLRVDTTEGPGGDPIPASDFVKLRLNSDGKLDWDVPEGDWTILRIGHVPTGKDNHPAPPEGDGLEVDKLSRSALDTHWAGMMAKVIAECGPLAGKVLNNSLIDSYEVGSQNWTPKMLAEFKKRRGYDMEPWLPVIAGFPVESREKSERFLWDLRRTIADLYAENYFGYFGELCHRAGMKFSTEPYGNGGFDNIQVGGLADIPMGEFWVGGGTLETTKLASSVGHVYGRPVIGAESFTADDNRGKFLEEPYAAKALGDFVFCNGINRYIFHRYAMQPWLNLKPGMTMGPWGTHLERTQTWWTEAATWLKYVARCQYLLQKGRFVADALYYYGEGAPVDLPYGSGLKPTLPKGYDYDGIDASLLMKSRVENRRIVLPSGMSYAILCLPDSQFMTPKLANKIRDLVKAGAVVVGPKPSLSPSLSSFPDCDSDLRKTADEVWGPSESQVVETSLKRPAVWRTFGSGVIATDVPLSVAFKNLNLGPDFSFTSPVPRAKIAYIHRKIDDADIYFVSNQQYGNVAANCSFRIRGKAPELWHADSGVIEMAPVYRSANERTVVSLNLGPAESVFVVFRKPASGSHLTSFEKPAAITNVKAPQIAIKSARYESADGRGVDVTEVVAGLVKEGQTEISATNDNFGDPVVNVVKRLVIDYTLNGKPVKQTVAENETITLLAMPKLSTDLDYQLRSQGRDLSLISWRPGTYAFETSKGQKRTVAVKYVLQPIDLSSNWNVKFPPNWGAPPSVELSKLISWPDSNVTGIKYFSGSAVYSKDFDVPSSMIGVPLMLDLGRVKNFATVRLNGRELAVLWKEPFTVDVTNAIKKGKNHLEIKITNLWPNRIIGDEQLEPDVEWNGASLKEWPSWINSREPRPKTGRYTFVTWKFWNKDSPLLESGLIGPVMLRAAKVQTIRP